jgi:hypothetical protein
MTEKTLDQKLHALIEREREILKKISVAYRAGASSGVMGHLEFMLEECRADQMDTRLLLKSDKKDSGFDDFLSIG